MVRFYVISKKIFRPHPFFSFIREFRLKRNIHKNWKLVSSYFDPALKFKIFRQKVNKSPCVKHRKTGKFVTFVFLVKPPERLFLLSKHCSRISLEFWCQWQSQWSHWYGYRFASLYVENFENDIYFMLKKAIYIYREKI